MFSKGLVGQLELRPFVINDNQKGNYLKCEMKMIYIRMTIVFILVGEGVGIINMIMGHVLRPDALRRILPIARILTRSRYHQSNLNKLRVRNSRSIHSPPRIE